MTKFILLMLVVCMIASIPGNDDYQTMVTNIHIKLL